MILFLVGLAASIPLSILANILTPKWQVFWARRSEAAQLAEAEMWNEHERIIQWFKENPVSFNSYLLRAGFVALRHLVAILFAAGLSITIFVVKGELDGWARAWLLGLAVVSMILGYVWLIWLLGTLGQARNMVAWVGNRADWPVNAAMTRYMAPLEDEPGAGGLDPSAPVT
ncbi:hypothetical protein [Actinoplanes sp. M2I2]|uniref:hypothetical protein n=1 Tax=Actinoplanes sp. M2I2 TaxID=1734444 RepID=UPI002020F898|nr:hypothetical protein [Actinoplanes sp. M2I2]